MRSAGHIMQCFMQPGHFWPAAIFTRRDTRVSSSSLGWSLSRRASKEETYGRALSYAKERRETVDYHIEATMTPDEAGIIIADARNFLERIERAFDEMGLQK